MCVAGHTESGVKNMKANEPEKRPACSLPGVEKKRGAGLGFPVQTDPVHPPVSDPPVPNRARTEMRTEFPPEIPGDTPPAIEIPEEI